MLLFGAADSGIMGNPDEEARIFENWQKLLDKPKAPTVESGPANDKGNIMRKMTVQGWAIIATSGKTKRFGESVISRNSVGPTGVGFYEAQSMAETALKYFKKAKVVPVVLEMREVSKSELKAYRWAAISQNPKAPTVEPGP